jgi:N4-gp56 family major capsid protein
MAVNLAEKYSAKVDEVIKNGAQSAPSVNNDYDFVGVKAVKVYSFDPVEMNDYVRSGTNRYGTPEELPDTTQEMILTQDRSFTFTIDKGNRIDTPAGVREAGKALRRQVDLVIQPEIDKYRFTKIAENAGHVFFDTDGVTSSTAYSLFLKANEAIDEADIPSAGRVCNCSPQFLNLIKQDDAFIKAGDLSQNMLVKGQIGEIDGVAIIKVATSRLPAGCLFEITHAAATVAPVKLEEYKIHEDPPGISGQLAEGRVYYDAFVLNKKKDMISVVYGNTGSLTLTASAGSSSTKSKVKVTGNTAGGTLVYKGDFASAATAKAAIDVGDDVSNWTEFPSDGEVTTADGKYIAVAVKVDGKCVSGGTVAAVVGS